MTKTFTLHFDITEKKAKETKISNGNASAEPSAQTIQNILNYSKNLEVRRSANLSFIEFVKS